MSLMPECQSCGSILTGRQKKYCSNGCQKREGRRQHVLKCFGITLEEYEMILEEQKGKCGICGRAPKPERSLAVDHSHQLGKSGPVRGLLCFTCNRRVVGARSDETIMKMAEYIQDPPAIRALGRVVIAPGRPSKKRQPRKRKRNGGG